MLKVNNAHVNQVSKGQLADHYEVWKGSRVVRVTHDKEFGNHFTYRLYVNNGETASLRHGKSKTQRGVQNFCKETLGL